MEFLSKTRLFKGFSGEQINEMLTGIDYSVESFSKGDLVLRSGQTYDSLVIIIEGLLCSEVVGGSGSVVRLKNFSSYEVIAPALVFGEEVIFPADLRALADSRILKIKREHFFRLLTENQMLLASYLKLVAEVVHFMSDKLEFLNFNTIRRKLAFYLIRETEKAHYNGRVEIRVTELAEFFGIERPSLSAVVCSFVDEGLISRLRRGVFVVADLSGIMAELD
ncbi:MAG: Crp/Fnr family transcriptional regulator [Spirochaetales bacterium]|nr:Crp/Fnr family transcriptional regulator [Spirochaetales bacterium]